MRAGGPRTEWRRGEQAEAATWVSDVAGTAVGIGEGVRWLLQIGEDKKLIGEGFGTTEYMASPWT